MAFIWKPEDGVNIVSQRVTGIRVVNIDKKGILPYSPYLCKVFNAYINSGFCNSMKTCQICLQIWVASGGVGMFGVQAVEENDEILSYQTAR